MKLFDIVKRGLAKAEALVEIPTKAGEPRYSRFDRHPANAHLALRAGDRVLANGQVVAKDAPRPIGDLINDEWRL